MSGTIALPGSAAQFTFAATAGQRVFLEGTDADFGGDTWALVGPSGQVFSSPVQNTGPVTLPDSGQYTLTLSTYIYNANVQYAFEFWNAPLSPPVAISPDQDISGALTYPLQTDTYTVTAAAGEQFYFDFYATRGGQYATVTGPNGQVVTSPIDQSVPQLIAPVAGQYTITIGDAGPANISQPDNALGDYSFALRTVTPINVGDVVQVPVPGPTAGTAFAFTGTAGERLFFSKNLAPSADPFVEYILLAPNGQRVWTNYEYQGDRDTFALPTNGEYTLVAQVEAASGDLSFQFVAVAADQTTPIQLNDTVLGQIETFGQRV